MAPNKPQKANTAVAWFSIACGVVSLAVRIGAATNSIPWGVAAGIALGVLLGWLLRTVRHQGDARVAKLNPEAPSMLATFDIMSLPKDWRVAARETMGALGGQTGAGMMVDLQAADGWLTVERHRRRGSQRPAFVARAPLRAVRTVSSGPTLYGVRGSSLTFDLAGGEQLRFGLGASPEAAERAAAIFRGATDRAMWDPPRPGDGIEIISKPPALRMPPTRAIWMSILFLFPMLVATAGIKDGALSAVAGFGGFILATLLRLFRPRWMGKVLVAAMALCAVGFGADGVRLGQPWRLVVAFCCVLLAAHMEVLNHRPSKHRRLPEAG